MQVFDFDNTLYHGESTVDFAMFMIQHNRRILLWVPRIFWNLLKYKLCLTEQKQMERDIREFLLILIRNEQQLRALVDVFWTQNRHKLNTRLISRIRREDVIVSAAPDFLLDALRPELGDVRLVCSKVDLSRKRLLHLNFGAQKVKRFRALYGNTKIERFYTDSYNDKAMMDIAEKVYLVRPSGICRIK